jgi:superfamily II DNA helicase RecQ
MALTATSTKKVKGDIMEHLQLMEDNTDVIFKSPDRLLPSTCAILPRQSFRVPTISETVSMERQYIMIFLELLPLTRICSINQLKNYQ